MCNLYNSRNDQLEEIFKIPDLPAEDCMTQAEFDEILRKGLQQAKAGQC